MGRPHHRRRLARAAASCSRRRGPRTFEFVIIGLLAIIAVGFTVGVFVAPPDAGRVIGGLVPRFADADSVLLAASILGATIMPHAIYAHSALSRDRFATRRGEQAGGPGSTRTTSWHGFGIRRGTDVAPELLPGTAHCRHHRPLLRATRWDVTIAMAIAGTVNLCILLLAAVEPRGRRGHRQPRGRLRGARRRARPGSSRRCSRSGCSPRASRRPRSAPTPAPRSCTACCTCGCRCCCAGSSRSSRRSSILALGFDPTVSLVLSQVVLSFGIPFALIPLVALTAKAGVLGRWKNHWATTAAGIAASVFLITLNGVLLWLGLTGGGVS